eukprot:CAMPEP_0168340610 /NCGR_PEP_ID=MMETSP0213-20121227/14163_1 /TAXON_ID=151035 /ORGANISM="Euplotes harpa, Strain FSP1.4" /LENGTH=112 /DNA_ID=CAMNT_0008346873 /DNA_START=224 /DNA_END=562 /DNA_ORIENTATION=+
MSHGNIDNWDEMEHVWNYIYKEMKVSASQHPVLISEVIDNPITTREKMAEKFFEYMSVPALYIQSQPILSLYAARSQELSSILETESLNESRSSTDMQSKARPTELTLEAET